MFSSSALRNPPDFDPSWGCPCEGSMGRRDPPPQCEICSVLGAQWNQQITWNVLEVLVGKPQCSRDWGLNCICRYTALWLPAWAQFCRWRERGAVDIAEGTQAAEGVAGRLRGGQGNWTTIVTPGSSKTLSNVEIPFCSDH